MSMYPTIDAVDRAYAEREKRAAERGLAKGKTEGLAEGLSGSLLDVYEARFGAVPEPIAAAVAKTKAPTTLRQWLRVFATASVEEIAAAVVPAKARAKRAAAKAPAKKRAKTPAPARRARRAKA